MGGDCATFLGQALCLNNKVEILRLKVCDIIFTNLQREGVTKKKGKKCESARQYYPRLWQEVLRMPVPIEKFEGIAPHGNILLEFYKE